MPGGKQVCANLARGDEQLVELQMVVAEAARNRRASGKILVDEGPDYVVLKTRLLIDDVIRNTELFSDVTCIVDIVDGAAAPLHRLGHALVAGQPALVPKLQGESDDVVAALAQHGRYGRGVDPSRHGYGNGLGPVVQVKQILIRVLLPSAEITRAQ